ncbi:MAG: TIGR04283 family arsenosugar biosynthesis glycosyltransferase [Ignavibacteria bacterium]|nr:TIGR04283 family arsenosugar biosynthesis glycosyltransferase [Ignavibacteria bacterium]
MNKFSVIIPTLNEETYILEVLNHLSQFKENIEIIITDGGSDDNTLKIARTYDTKVVSSKKGKGIQLNSGALYSTGEILIFMHADTFLPEDAFARITEYFINKKIDIASFKMKFDSPNNLAKIYSWFTKFDSRITTFGDQVIVMNRNFYQEIGGFPIISLFEDVELLKQARKKTKIYKLPTYVTTSARRFKKYGFIKTQLLNLWYHLLYYCGVSTEKLHKYYFKDKLH